MVLIMKFSPLPCYLVPLRPKYSPPHPILKHPQPTFLPQCQRPSFTLIRNNMENYGACYLCHIHTVKIKTLPCFAIHNALKECCEVEVQIRTFIISAMDTGENSIYEQGGSALGMNPWHQYRRLVGPLQPLWFTRPWPSHYTD
jgi:hypothetical protein